MKYPKIGIRPTIDGRQGGVRESLEEKTMALAHAVADLISSNLRNGDGSPVECVIADGTIGRVAESAACAGKFEREGVGSTITVTSCWCYGSETMDMHPHWPKAVWGFNGTERPGAVYLAAVLAAHAQKGLPAFGIYGHDVQNADETEIPEEVKTRCKLGDLWQLGNHRLICGDSTDVAVIDRLMDGVKADCVFTDPPYGMKKESEGVLNDNLNSDDLLDFNRQWIPLTFGALKDNGSWYCWGIDESLMDIYSNILKPMARENKITFRNLITWDKGTGQGQLSSGFMMYPPSAL